MFIESIQQSPIDINLSASESPPLMSSIVSEENPLSPPIETPLIASPGTRMRVWKIKDWIHQLVEPLVDGVIVVERCADGSSVEVRSRNGTSSIRVAGIEIHHGFGEPAKVFEETGIDTWVKDLYLQGQFVIENWRSRIVRLSLDTDDVECSLMDDVYPPRTFLAEYKSSVLLKSIKVHDGMLFLSTLTRTISVPVSLLEDEPDGKVSQLLCSAAPELTVLDIDGIYDQFVELRRMCIDEDKRLTNQNRVNRGESGDLSTIDITVGGG